MSVMVAMVTMMTMMMMMVICTTMMVTTMVRCWVVPSCWLVTSFARLLVVPRRSLVTFLLTLLFLFVTLPLLCDSRDLLKFRRSHRTIRLDYPHVLCPILSVLHLNHIRGQATMGFTEYLD